MTILQTIKKDGVAVANAAFGFFGYKLEMAESANKEKLAGSPNMAYGYGSTNEDIIVAAKGIEGYRLMDRDPEIAADTDLRLVGMMPGVQIIPADADEDAKRASELVNAVMTSMKGSVLDVLRDQMLRESVTAGISIYYRTII